MNTTIIKDYAEIAQEFERITNSITQKNIRAKITLLPREKMYKKTNGRPAYLSRNMLWGPDKIYVAQGIKEEVMYNLAHEIGHAIKPNLEHNLLVAEETKACLFQTLFSEQIKQQNTEFSKSYALTEQIKLYNTALSDNWYHEIYTSAQILAIKTDYDFELGLKHIIDSSK